MCSYKVSLKIQFLLVFNKNFPFCKIISLYTYDLLILWIHVFFNIEINSFSFTLIFNEYLGHNRWIKYEQKWTYRETFTTTKEIIKTKKKKITAIEKK